MKKKEEQKTTEISSSDEHAFAMPAMTREEKLIHAIEEKDPKSPFSEEYIKDVVSPETIQIHVSKDYSEFEFLEENRDLDYDKANKFALLSLTEYHNFFSSNPIIVNTEIKQGLKSITDGQSRFLGSRLIKGPIYYIIDNNINIENMSALNINQSNWTKLNYAKHFAGRSFSHYVYLMNLWKEYPKMDLHCLIDLLKYSSKKSTVNYYFKKGLFKLTEEEIKKTEIFLQEIDTVYDFYERKYKKTFISSLMKLKNQRLYDHENMIKNVKLYKSKFHSKLFSKEMVYDVLVEVHNMHKSKNRIKIK